MNVIFHIAAGTGIIAANSHFGVDRKNDQILMTGIGFALGVLSHGILDYIPHCYPINSKVDAIAGLLIIFLGIWKVKSKWKIPVAFTFLGCVIPDLIDLSPRILNSLLSMSLPTFDNIFYWHQPDYSGSVYAGNCEVSTINHILTLVFVAIVLFVNGKSIRKILR